MSFLKSVKNFGNDVGHSVKSGTSSVTHLLTEPEHKIESAVGTAYKDGRSAVSTAYKDGRSAAAYTGKHLINDVDSISSMLSSPLLIIGVVAVGLIIITKK